MDWNDLPKIKMDDFDNTILGDDISVLSEESNSDKKDSQYISVDIDKPDKNKINKIVSFFAIIFFLVTIPIFYHKVHDYIQTYMMPVVRIGDWAQSPIPNPQSPIPNPQ